MRYIHEEYRIRWKHLTNEIYIIYHFSKMPSSQIERETFQIRRLILFSCVYYVIWCLSVQSPNVTHFSKLTHINRRKIPSKKSRDHMNIYCIIWKWYKLPLFPYLFSSFSQLSMQKSIQYTSFCIAHFIVPFLLLFDRTWASLWLLWEKEEKRRGRKGIE